MPASCSSSIAGGLAGWLKQKGMDHIRGASSHPQAQGKIERWDQRLKDRRHPEAQIGTFVGHYNLRGEPAPRPGP